MIINPQTKQQKFYSFGPTLHGGGYDDIVFRGCQVFISASNPSNIIDNTGPAIVRAHLSGTIVDVDPVLAGDASAFDIPTDQTIQLNLTDPDSMTSDPLGNLVLDSQGDDELIFVSNPNTKSQRVLHLPLTYLPPNSTTPTSVEVDDTAFTTSSQGYILFADKNLNTVYRLDKVAFPPEHCLHCRRWSLPCWHHQSEYWIDHSDRNWPRRSGRSNIRGHFERSAHLWSAKPSKTSARTGTLTEKSEPEVGRRVFTLS